MTDILPPPQPPPNPPPPLQTHTLTQQTSLSLPELCWLYDCLACVCAAPSCVDVPEDCSIYFWEPLHQQCPRDVILNSSTGAYDWVVNMDCVDSRSQTLDCQALGQLLRNPQPRRNSRRNGYRDSGKFLIVIGWVVSSLVRCSVGDLFMIWVSGCITVAGLVLGETEGRNYNVLLGPVKKRLFLTRLPAYVYFDLWVQTDPISKQNTMHGSFLKQWSSNSKQIWFQAAVDACATTWTGPSTATPEMADLFQRTSVPFCAPMWCTHLPSWKGTIWRPLSGMTRAQTGHVSCHQKLLPLLLRSPAEHCGGHPVNYMQLYVDMHDAFHRVRGLHVWNHAIYCCCWCGYALWQMHTVGWEDCVCPFFNFYYLFIILPLVHTHRLRRIVSISVRWMLLCKEVIIAEDSPYVTMQHMTF